MPESGRIVVVGSGLAGATAAGSLRERGYRGEVLVLGTDPHRPYELPPLSKALMLGETDEPDWVYEDGFYADHDIDLYTGVTVTDIDVGARRVTDDRGAEHAYDRLVLATGSRPRLLPLPGVDLPGVRTLRRLDDALALRARLRESARVVIVGAGWIGTEVAAAARGHGAEVTIVDPVPLPLVSVLGDEVASVFHDMHTEHGVTWRLGAFASEFTGGPDGVRGVRLSDGDELPADVVLVAVGAAPHVDLARAAGLDLTDDGGVAVDGTLRSSVPEVYAIGDIASQLHPRYGRRIRVEHWANAKGQGAHVAGAVLGDPEPYRDSPYFFTDQYDLGCEYRGIADPRTDQLVVRGDLGAREFIAFWLRDGRVQAAMNVNIWDFGDALQRMVDERLPVDTDLLTRGDLAAVE